MDLAGRGAIVTGGRRIGAEVARALALRGARVVLTFNRSRVEAEQTVEEIRRNGGHALALQADLSEEGGCRRFVDEAVAALGHLDILVHMASVYESTPYDELTGSDWDAALSVDLRASHLCAQAAVPHMRARQGGRIVLFADWVAASGRPRYTGYLPYYVAKAGVIGLTEILALELSKDRILVNAVAPGPILPPEGISAEEASAVERATPLGHWGGSGEIAKTVLFLIDADFVTGEVIRVDGGRHLK